MITKSLLCGQGSAEWHADRREFMLHTLLGMPEA